MKFWRTILIGNERYRFFVPVLVMRDTTERPKGIAEGTLKLLVQQQRLYIGKWND